MAFETGSYVTVRDNHGRESCISYGEQLKVVASDPDRMVVYLEGFEDAFAWVRFEEYPY